jgi:hypothetical protein
MGEVVNLRRARKAKARGEAAQAAAENRAKHGRSTAERKAEALADARQTQRHDGHRLDKGD